MDPFGVTGLVSDRKVRRPTPTSSVTENSGSKQDGHERKDWEDQKHAELHGVSTTESHERHFRMIPIFFCSSTV